MERAIKKEPEIIEKKKNKTFMENKVLPVCSLCNKVPKGGIRSGFFLKGIFICESCEKDLINSSPKDHQKYISVIEKLKPIIFKYWLW